MRLGNQLLLCLTKHLLLSKGVLSAVRWMTSCFSIAVDLRNAGADWVDEPVVQDDNIITSRKAADLPIFDWTIIEAIRANG